MQFRFILSLVIVACLMVAALSASMAQNQRSISGQNHADLNAASNYLFAQRRKRAAVNAYQRQKRQYGNNGGDFSGGGPASDTDNSVPQDGQSGDTSNMQSDDNSNSQSGFNQN